MESHTLLSHLAEAWAYVTLAASGIITEEAAPIVGGFAAHEGHLGITRVIFACALGTWSAGVGLYVLGFCDRRGQLRPDGSRRTQFAFQPDDRCSLPGGTNSQPCRDRSHEYEQRNKYEA